MNRHCFAGFEWMVPGFAEPERIVARLDAAAWAVALGHIGVGHMQAARLGIDTPDPGPAIPAKTWRPAHFAQDRSAVVPGIESVPWAWVLPVAPKPLVSCSQRVMWSRFGPQKQAKSPSKPN